MRISGEKPIYDIGDEVWIPDYDNENLDIISFVRTTIVSVIYEMREDETDGKIKTSFAFYTTEYDDEGMIRQDFMFDSEDEAIDFMGKKEWDL